MKVLGRLQITRRIAPLVSNRRLATPAVEADSLFPPIDVTDVTRALRLEGLAIGIDVPQEIVREIVAFANGTPCFGNADPRFGFAPGSRREAEVATGQRFVLGTYFNTAAGCPVIRRIEQDPKLWAIAEKYFRTTPRHIGTQLWWSFADVRSEAEKKRYAQLYHYDLDGYAFLKFFFYLTDVIDDHSGPHACVRGTHRRKALRHRLRYTRFSDDDIIGHYGIDRIAVMYGKAGSGFVEDTFCLHKGLAPTRDDRLILQVQFGLQDFDVQHDHMSEAELRYVV